MRLADAPAIEQHAIAGPVVGVVAGFDDAGDVDAGHHRKLADNRPLAGDRQAVLVVKRRVRDSHGNVAFRQLTIVDVLHRRTVTGLILLDQNSLEHVISLFNAAGMA